MEAGKLTKSRFWRSRPKMKLVLLLTSMVVLLLLLVSAGCGGEGVTGVPATAAVTPTTGPAAATPMAMPEDMFDEGQAAYAKGCAVCHGQEGEGTTLAPMVAGHSISAVKIQVRKPMGTMPSFSQAQLSDAELDEVAAFLSSLGEAEASVQDWEKAAPETMHYWLALLAIKTGDAQNAKHHLEDVLGFIREPVQRTKMEEALGMMGKGNMHDAEHEIEEMAGSESPAGISVQRFHLTLAMSGVEAENANEVKHHLDHFMAKATEEQKEIVKEALEKIEMNDFHEAEHEIEELMQE